METSGMDKYLEKEDPKLEISRKTMSYLNEIRKWANFFAILGFVTIGILVLLGLIFGLILGDIPQNQAAFPFPSYMIAIIYIVLAMIYIFPALYMYKFSAQMKSALNTKNSEDLEGAFLNLKSHFKFVGIFTIILIGIYALIFVGFILIGLMGFLN